LSALRAQMEQLSHEVGSLRDVHAVRRLLHAYGYYLDKCLYDEVVDLFAERGEVRFMGGIFRGRYHGLFDTGWRHTPAQFVPFFDQTYPADPLGPDELMRPLPVLWPQTEVVPFHYPHPVTGKPWQAG